MSRVEENVNVSRMAASRRQFKRCGDCAGCHQKLNCLACPPCVDRVSEKPKLRMGCVKKKCLHLVLISRRDRRQLAGLGTVDPLETCQMCEKKFRRGGNMQRHTEVMHTPRPVPVPCTKKQFCTMSFPTVHEMVQHREHCNFICANCGKSIKRGKRVAGHTKSCPGKE